jgi:hypothetical protein
MNMTASALTDDRVRRSTAAHLNRRIDDRLELSIRLFAHADRDTITARIRELDGEWDTERLLECNASSLALVGTTLGLLSCRKWLLVPMIVTGFLLNHAVRGWCPPIPIMRRLGIRTCREIERERYALKALRGDFGGDLRDPEVLLRALDQ